MQKTLKELAGYLKNIIPANIPEAYTLKPIFKSIGDDETIRNGIVAFRDFLFLICDHLIADGDKYEKPAKNTKNDASHPSLPVSYPFLNNIKSVLFNIGYHGELAENHTSILLGDLQSLTSIIGDSGEQMKAKISVPKIIEVLKFLTYCGVFFDGIDLNSGKPDMSKAASLEISYPDNPVMLIGLKAMAIAQKELHTKGNDSIFLRCDYRVLKDEDREAASLLKEFVNPLHAKIQDFALNLHQRYLDAGLTCKVVIDNLNIRFIYWYKNIELWSFMASFGDYRILIKAQNTHQYTDVIKTFPMPLQEKISKGYGCEKKRYGEPCQKGCHGFGFSLDESVLETSKYIEIWLDREIKGFEEGFNNVPIKSPSQTTPLTLNFNDMTPIRGNCPYSISKDGALSVNYGGKYKEIKFYLPSGVSLANCNAITVNGISAGVQTAIKFYHTAVWAMQKEKFAMWNNKTSITSDWTYELNESDKSRVIRAIGIMSQENADNCCAVINSLTFS